MTAPDDAGDVLSALRLGWYLAEVRGRNRPAAPAGALASLPDRADHALPLRIERTKTELRIEAQAVVAQLAKALGVDDQPDGGSFSRDLDNQARLLAHVRAPKAMQALQRAADLLQRAEASEPPASGSVASGSAAPEPAPAEQVAAGPEATRSASAGPTAAGPEAAGSASAGPGAAGSASAGPGAAGSASAGPGAAGPEAAGSAAAGPVAPESAAARPVAAVPGAVGPAAGPGGAAPALVGQAAAVLASALAGQQRIVAIRAHGAASAEQVLAQASEQVAATAAQSAKVRSKASAQHATALAAVRSEEAALAGERAGAEVLQLAGSGLRQAIDAGAVTAARGGLVPIRAGLQVIDAAAAQPWQSLAELIWRFDAHIQDQLAAASETQACGYQLGRSLAETYWALDPGQVDGSAGWTFLLGSGRCTEISRLVGRLAIYMGQYTAPAIAGSVEVWKAVAATPKWRGEDGVEAGHALYRQVRRWYELVILGQDPTTLIGPFNIMANYRTIGRALRLFWPQLIATLVGLVFLGALLISLSVGSGTSLQRTVSGVLAAGGLSLAGLTGKLKNSAQAMVRRLHQDAYTELVAIAVQTAPPPPRKSMVHQAMKRRELTTATPN